MRISYISTAVACWLAGLSACNSPTEVSSACSVGPNATEAVVTMAWTSRPDSLRVLVRNAETIRAACTRATTGTGSAIMSGRIVRGAGVDPRVPFHYVPETVTLADLTIELCDSSLLRTTTAVDEFFLGSTGDVNSPSAPYCPWSAPPVKVEPVP